MVDNSSDPNVPEAAMSSPDQLERTAGCLRTLAHPIRLRIVELLLAGEYTVGELARACGSRNHVMSEHLGIMHDRGLLSRERRGRRIYYSVAMPALKGIIDCMRDQF